MERCVKHPMRNPFYEAPRPKAFYHPSAERSVPDRLKRRSQLSPERASPPEKHRSPDRRFLDQAGYVELPSRVSTVSQDLSESWPDTERSSPPQIDFDKVKSSSRNDLYDPFNYSPEKRERNYAEPEKETKETEVDGSSVLSKYLHRFRHGKPTSRQERQMRRSNPERDFWWRSAESFGTSSKPRKPEPEPAKNRRTPSPPVREKSPATPVRRTTPSPPVRGYKPSPPLRRRNQSPPGKDQTHVVGSSPGRSRVERPSRSRHKLQTDVGKENRDPVIETERQPGVDEYTRELQHKTDRILEWSESTLSELSDRSGPGPGYVPLRHPTSDGDDDVTDVRRTDVRDVKTDFMGRLKPERDVHYPERPSVNVRNVPDEDPQQRHLSPRKHTGDGLHQRHLSPRKQSGDILQQWRLRRKMETARQQPSAYARANLYSHHLAYEDNDPSPRKPSPGIHFTPPHKKKHHQAGSGVGAGSRVEEPVVEAATENVLPPCSPHKHYLCDILPCKLQTKDQDTHQCLKSERKERKSGNSGAVVLEIPESGTLISDKPDPVGEYPSHTIKVDDVDISTDERKMRKKDIVTEVHSAKPEVDSGSESCVETVDISSVGEPNDKICSDEVIDDDRVVEMVDKDEKVDNIRPQPAKPPKQSKKRKSKPKPNVEKVESETGSDHNIESESVDLMSPVKRAVNEAVTEHLFVATPRKAVIEDSESDDDESVYKDDELLQQLMTQQDKYTKQLTLIDKLLEKLMPP